MARIIKTGIIQMANKLDTGASVEEPCAHRLAMHGHRVTVFEARSKAGGLNDECVGCNLCSLAYPPVAATRLFSGGVYMYLLPESGTAESFSWVRRTS